MTNAVTYREAGSVNRLPQRDQITRIPQTADEYFACLVRDPSQYHREFFGSVPKIVLLDEVNNIAQLSISDKDGTHIILFEITRCENEKGDTFFAGRVVKEEEPTKIETSSTGFFEKIKKMMKGEKAMNMPRSIGRTIQTPKILIYIPAESNNLKDNYCAIYCPND
ncbi:MAG: hypothetical protein ACOZAN_02925 [Patescibacteria group bacterium]